MALVITVAQQKGGTGKTTLAANLAAALAADRRVAVLDIDPQRSLTRWHELRAARAKPAPAITGANVSGWRLGAELDRLRRAHDVVLIDSPPHIDTDARLAVRAADLVLVPLQPSLPDVWAVEGTLNLAAAEKRPVAIVLNRVPATSRLRDSIAAQLTGRGLRLLPTGIGNRAGFANAFAEGLGITEAAPRSTGARELRALLDDLMEMTR
jgi:chromosome partitioning protein